MNNQCIEVFVDSSVAFFFFKQRKPNEQNEFDQQTLCGVKLDFEVRFENFRFHTNSLAIGYNIILFIFSN